MDEGNTYLLDLLFDMFNDDEGILKKADVNISVQIGTFETRHKAFIF